MIKQWKLRREMKKQGSTRGFWQGRGGDWIRISDMGTDHLANTIAMLDRNAAKHILLWAISTCDVFPKIIELQSELSVRLARLETELGL